MTARLDQLHEQVAVQRHGQSAYAPDGKRSPTQREHDGRDALDLVQRLAFAAGKAEGLAEGRRAPPTMLGETPVEVIDRILLGGRTLADIDDAPPADLLLGMLEPDGPTVLNASGGTGKGTSGAWMIRELQAAGMKPMIYDAENRPREWARRTSGLGVDRSRVLYFQPGDLPSKLLGQPLWEVAPHLGKVAHAHGGDVLFVDSILPAVGVGEERLKSDAQVPYLYVNALDVLGMPSVSFAHPPKGQPNGDPFGSVAWVNAPRLTWQGTPGEGDRHRVRWRPRKRNERGHIAGVLLTFDYDPDGRLSGAEREDDDEATRDWILGTLTREPKTIPSLTELLIEEMDESPSPEHVKRIEDRLGHALRRMKREGFAYQQGKAGRADLWHLKVEKGR